MSVRVMSDVFSAEMDSPTDKLVLLALADHAADDGSSVYPSVKHLSLKCDMSERTVQRYLRRLEQADLIRVEKKSSRYAPTRYQLNLAAIRARIPAEDRGDKRVTPEPARGDSGVTPEAVRGDNRGRSGVTPVSPESSVEPSGEPNHHRARVAKGDPEGFDLFWSQYPRKEAKERARKAWAQIEPDDATRERILAALEVQKRSEGWKRDGGRYIPHPASWLNARRWEDEVEAAGAADDDETQRRLRILRALGRLRPDCRYDEDEVNRAWKERETEQGR